ncbi:hypothetical protein OF83DRAFT_1092639 [Amylostereum chailletii]|nr:hypothetical protein OF83DRAFT_1092639 [Amylostereum chailletii]
MSVATKNPFALLDDDDSQPSTPPPATKKPEAPAPAAPAAKPRGPASRGGKYYSRGGKTPRESQDAEEPAEDGGKKRFDGEGRGRGRGRGRGDRGDRGRGGRGRPFDRHSQTGKTDSDKKVHQGWGGDEGHAELKAEEAATTDAVAETSNDWAGAATDGGDWGAAPAGGDQWVAPPAAEGDPAPADGEKPEGRRREREVEEEDNTLTYEQYLAQKKEAEGFGVPKLEGRQANEGNDEIWKDAVAQTKKSEEEDAYFVGKTKSAPKARAKKDDKIFLEIEARFERPSRGGRGRGSDRGGDRGGDRGRGEGRGRGRGRGAPRTPRSNGTPAVNVDDETAFPSLS